MSRVRVFTGEIFKGHHTGDHAETPLRVKALIDEISHWEQDGLIETAAFETASTEDLARVHGRQHIDHVRSVSARGGGWFDADTVACADSFDVATDAAGAALAATRAVLEADGVDASRAMAWVRPPGHHARPEQAMGFCLFNNVAVAARYAVDVCGVERVLIVDWDVHHGNGTQEIFYEDGTVYFLSLHRAPFYPGTGSESETGALAGLGTTLNIPLAFGLSRKEYLDHFRSALDRAVSAHRPGLILISAGFDAHRLDPVGSLGLEIEDFSLMTKSVVEAAESYCGGRIVSVLEGGYHLAALVESVKAHLRAMASR